MKNGRKILIAAVVLVVCSLALVVAGLRGAKVSPARVRFVGFTNASSGVKIARFEIRNQLGKGISRSGYCRVNGDTVDIMPPKTVPGGETEVIDVPLTTRSGEPITEPVRSVTFNGARSLTLGEEVRLAMNGLLQSAGLRDSDGESELQNRWELKYEFRDGVGD